MTFNTARPTSDNSFNYYRLATSASPLYTETKPGHHAEYAAPIDNGQYAQPRLTVVGKQ